jgi:hypothetical protein
MMRGNDQHEIVDEVVEAPVEHTETKEDIPDVIKKRLGQQEKKHKRELRAMQDQLAQMQHHMMAQQQQSQMPQNGVDQPAQQQQMQPQFDQGRQLDMQRLEDEFTRDLERASEKYEDFDEIINDRRLPFTNEISTVLRVLPNPGDVIHALGKNRDELYRIAGLSPHAQAKELTKLSTALTIKEKSAPKTQPKVMGQLKSNAAGTKAPGQIPSVSDFRKMLRNRGK